MNALDVKQRRQQILDEIANREALLKAYELVEKDLSGKSNEPIVAIKNVAPMISVKNTVERTSSSGGTSATSVIRNSLPHMPPTFTMNHVDDWLSAQGSSLPRLKISFVLSRLVKQGEILMIRQGKGKAPGQYSLKPIPVSEPEIEDS